MSFRQAVIEAICTISDQDFSVNEVREICESSYPSMPYKKIHSNVYKYMWALTQKGYLECHVNEKNNRNNRYSITPVGYHKMGLGVNEPSTQDEYPAEPVIPEVKQRLLQRLSDYSGELAAHSAEVQEYQDLSHQFPQLTAILQSKYQAAKENALRLQGRVKALESAIEELGL